MTTPAFLIDTHVLIWLDSSPERLSEHIVSMLSDSRHTVYCSAVSLWEIAIKQSVNKLNLPVSLAVMLERYNFTELPVTVRYVEAVRSLPMHHRDPFDRMLIAQAITDELVLITGDRNMLAYEVPILSC